jgi:23S rRNA pseudouridine1911/1915/1917 synthase
MQDFFEISDLIVDNNNQYIVALKLAGMPCVLDKSGDKNLKNLLESYAKHDLHIINRLDRPVSGLALFAKNTTAANFFTQQIKENKVRKFYLAIVEGKPKTESGELTDFLIKSTANKSVIGKQGDKDAKVATLKFETVVTLDNYTILKVELVTGRFHQIRSQLANYGCPIKGDVKYGARRKNKDRSIYLHAYELSFRHPVSLDFNRYKVAPNPNDSLWKMVPKNL